MKKAISLLVALAAAASLSAVSFAADDIPGTATNDGTDGTTTFSAPMSRVAPGTTDGDVIVGANELVLIDSKNQVYGADTHLVPDEEYKLNIYYNSGTTVTIPKGVYDSTVQTDIKRLTGTELGDGTIRIRTVKGSSAVTSAKIKTSGRGTTATYTMNIDTRAHYGTKMTDTEYNLIVTGSATTFADSPHTFEIGWPTIDDDATDIGEDGFITVSNDAPVITKDQFTDIAKSANYKAVNIEADDGSWHYNGRVSSTKDSNFYYSQDVVPALVEMFPDQDYKFINFKGGVTFSSAGKLSIDVSDISGDFDSVYTYLYRNGKLTLIDTTYDAGADEISFRTNHLGTFLLTEKQITDTSILDGFEEEEEPDEEPEEEDEDEDEGNLGGNNPNTGASGAMNVAVTAGLLSLVTASAIARKRK